MSRAEKLVDVAMTIAEVDASRGIAEQRNSAMDWRMFSSHRKLSFFDGRPSSD
ncbi:hypothetical protein NKJ10_25570 [Mesorhizobium sp. M0204]|uniref:hypothetical protein n=1 Tax=Mesorhizobium sp. M0204 TaxID=2956913 RepID=UPI003335C7B5